MNRTEGSSYANEHTDGDDYLERIRTGTIPPWVGTGADGARRSAQIIADELVIIAPGDPRVPGLEALRAAWLDLAHSLETEPMP